MCLVLNEMYRKLAFNKDGYIDAYKVFFRKKRNNALLSPVKEHPVVLNGLWYESNREDNDLTRAEKGWGFVDLGIHVYLDGCAMNKGIAIFNEYEDGHYFAVKCRGYEEDFVAANTKSGEAVFTKIEINEKDARSFGLIKETANA